MAYDPKKLVQLGSLKDVVSRVQDEYTADISKALEDAEFNLDVAGKEDIDEMLNELFPPKD